jgi:hypothetical protein
VSPTSTTWTRAIGVPWELPERDMPLVLRAMMQIGPAKLRADIAPDANLCVALKLPGAPPYVNHIHDGIAEFHGLRPDGHPDAVMRLPASTLAQMLQQRMGPVAAARHGLRVVGGRRPWKVAILQSTSKRSDDEDDRGGRLGPPVDGKNPSAFSGIETA